MKTTPLLSFLLIPLSFALQLSSNDWLISLASTPDVQDRQFCKPRSLTKISNTWMDYGLTKLRGRSMWFYKPTSKFEIYLYNNHQLTDYLIMSVYIKNEINWNLPFFNNTAHTTFAIYKNNTKVKEMKDYFYNPHVLFNNQFLIITQAKGDKLVVSMKSGQQQSLWLILPIFIHYLLKGHRLFFWGQKPLRSLKSVMIGWDMQFIFISVTITKNIIWANYNFSNQFFETPPLVFVIIFFIPFLLFLLNLIVCFSDQLIDIRNPSFYIGLIVFGCSNWLFLPTDLNFILYSLILLIQIRYNLQQEQIYFIDHQVLCSYLLNVGFILYLKGYAMNGWRKLPNYYLCVAIVIIVIVQYAILWKLSKRATLRHRQIVTGNKQTDLYKYTVVAVVAKNLNRNCLICQGPLLPYPISDLISQLEQKRYLRTDRVIQTSCNHFFHLKCLEAKTKDGYKCVLDGCSIPNFEI